MSVGLVRAALEADVAPAGRKLTLVALAERANSEGHSWPSRETLSRETGLSRRMLQLYIPALEREGWIRIERKGPIPIGYWLNMERLKPRKRTDIEPAGRSRASWTNAGQLGADLDAYARLTPQ